MATEDALPHISAAAYLASAAMTELNTAMDVCQSHGLFGDLKVQRDSLEPVQAALQQKFDELANVVGA